jgi:ribonuclease D
MTVPTQGPLPREIVRAISREEMADLPVGRYDGDVCLVRTTQDLEHALEDFHQEKFVGFDTETRPSFRTGDRHLPCLIQAATARVVYLFRLRQESDFQVPAGLVAEPGILKVGIGLADDIRALKVLYPFEESSTLDLGAVARDYGLGQTGVRNLAGIFMKIRIPKRTKTSNWAAPKLSAAQIHYAATDAWICRELFLRFRSLGMIPDARLRLTTTATMRK